MLYLFWHKMKVNEKQVKNDKKLFLVINYFVKNAISTTNYEWQVITGFYCWGKKVILVLGSNLNQ